MNENTEKLQKQSKNLKLVVIGPEGSGKTTLVQQFLQPGEIKATDIKPTIGVEHSLKKIILEDDNIELDINLDIWDCSGNSTFSAIRDSMLKDADIVIVLLSLQKDKDEEFLSNINTSIPDTAKLWVVGAYNNLLPTQQDKEDFKAINLLDSEQIEKFFIQAVRSSRKVFAALTNQNQKRNSISNSNPDDYNDGLSKTELQEHNEDIDKIFKFVQNEINRKDIDFHKGFAGIFYHKAEYNQITEPDGTKRYVTTTIKEAYENISSTNDKKLALGSIHQLFNNASHLPTHARSNVARTFYRAFDNPASAYYAKQTLERIRDILGNIDPNDDNIKTAHCSDIMQRNNLSSPSQVINKLYKKANNYHDITWQEALIQAETLLAKSYLSHKSSIKANNENSNINQVQSKINESFETIYKNYHLKLNNLRPEFKQKIMNGFNIFTSEIKVETRWTKHNQGLPTAFFSITGVEYKNFNCYTNIIDILAEANNILRTVGGLKLSKHEFDKRALALDYICYYLFELSHEIPYGRRNGSRLYNAMMSKIGECLGLNVSNIKDKWIIRRSVEERMKRYHYLYKARAHLFEEKYPEFAHNSDNSQQAIPNSR